MIRAICCSSGGFFVPGEFGGGSVDDGGLEGNPADALKIGLRPDVRAAAAHFVIRLLFKGEGIAVAGDGPCRDPGQAEQHDHSRCVVHAVAPAGLKEEAVRDVSHALRGRHIGLRVAAPGSARVVSKLAQIGFNEFALVVVVGGVCG